METVANIDGHERLASRDKGCSQLSAIVVICTHNRPVTLERCLKALQKIEYEELSTIIVDSAPSSDAAWVLSQRYKTGYIVSPIKGLSRARNIGAHAARGDIVAFLDDDMVPDRGWLSALAEGFRDAAVAAVTGPVLPLEAREVDGNKLRQLLEAAPWGPSPFEICSDSPSWFERANFGGVGDGNFALRRNVFGRFVEFEEGLGRGVTIDAGEDNYLFFRLVSSGHRVAYAPRAIVFHPVSPLSAQYSRQLIARSCAYGIFVAWRHPGYAWRIAKYYLEGMFRVRRRWRNISLSACAPRSRTAMLRGAFAGLRLFLRFRAESRAGSRSDDRRTADRRRSVHGPHEAGQQVRIPTWTR